MQTQGLNQHHVGELLYDQETSGPRITQLLPHPLQTPAYRCLVRFFPDVHYVGQFRQQNIGMRTAKNEVPSDKQAIPATIARGNTTIERERKIFAAWTGFNFRSLAKVRSEPTRQKKTIACLGRRASSSNASISHLGFYCYQQFGESALRSKLTQVARIACMRARSWHG